MRKGKLIKQVKEKVKTYIELEGGGVRVSFGKGFIGDTVSLYRGQHFYHTEECYMYKKKIVMDMYRVDGMNNKNNLRNFSKTSLSILQDDIVSKIVAYVKEWGSNENMFKR